MKFNLKNYLKQYWVENKRWLQLSGLIFGLGFGIGFLIVLVFPFVVAPFMDLLRSVLEKEIASIETSSNLQTAYFIGFRNLKATLIMSLGGVFFGLFPIFGLFVNGFILGAVMAAVMAHNPLNGLLVILFTVIPHGVIEIPALIMAGAWGLRLGLQHFSDQFKGRRLSTFFTNIKKWVMFIPMLVLLLVIAALLEAFVSGTLAKLMS